MKFTDTYVNREERFALGLEESSGRFYVSFPVSNGITDHEEYYAINRAQLDLFHKDHNFALAFVTKCRNRQLDELLIEKPGDVRGSAI
ncbi:MAG TPA: hypothetical protein VF672_07040 [Pseudomonas sp.]|jgi:hypothetical protein